MYYQKHRNMPWEGGPNVIICPNLDMGNLLYHLYGTRFPTAKKFPVMFGLRFRGVDLAMDSTPGGHPARGEGGGAADAHSATAAHS